jgi:hypothetical protein
VGYNSCTLPIPFNTLEPYPQGYANPWHSLDLIDGTRATGEFVFRGGQSPSPSHADDTTPAPFSYDGKIDPVLLQESNGGGVSDNEGTRVSSLSLTHDLTNIPTGCQINGTRAFAKEVITL